MPPLRGMAPVATPDELVVAAGASLSTYPWLAATAPGTATRGRPAQEAMPTACGHDRIPDVRRCHAAANLA